MFNGITKIDIFILFVVVSFVVSFALKRLNSFETLFLIFSYFNCWLLYISIYFLIFISVSSFYLLKLFLSNLNVFFARVFGFGALRILWKSFFFLLLKMNLISVEGKGKKVFRALQDEWKWEVWGGGRGDSKKE